MTIGQTYSQEHLVVNEDSAKIHGSGNLDVFSTPAMVGLMENTACGCIKELLNEGLDSVGIEINVKHIKTTKIGDTVTCTASLVAIDNKVLTFEIEAKDSQAVIGTAQHKRYIISPEKFLSRL